MERLTGPQKELLREMRESRTGGLYIAWSGRYMRTAMALARKGYVRREHVDGRVVWFEPLQDDNGRASDGRYVSENGKGEIS